MTRAFTPAQKYRILCGHRAYVLSGWSAYSVAKFFHGTYIGATERFNRLRKMDVAVQCACGCGVWAPLSEIEFDHETPWIQTRRSVIADGRPLRRAPCHRAKSASEQKVTGKITRLRNKLSVTIGLREEPPAIRSEPPRRSWPTRPMSHPTLKRRFDGRVERRMP